MICSNRLFKKLPFDVLQTAVCEKPAELIEELTLLKVRLWLVLEYFRNGNFREFWYWAGEFSSFWTGIPGGPDFNHTIQLESSVNFEVFKPVQHCDDVIFSFIFFAWENVNNG